MKNKNAWLRIVESFTTILLIATVLLLILNKTSISEAEKAEQILDREYAILREVQLNNTLRENVIAANLTITGKIIWDEFNEANGLALLKDMISKRIPGQLLCAAQLCELNNDCAFDPDTKESIYTRSALISATNDDYSPRRLKLFCWEI